MRIAIDIRNLGKQRTGDETVFFNLVKHLAEIDGENEYILLLDSRTPENLADLSARLGISEKKNFRLTPIGSGNKFVWNAYTAPKFLHAEKIGVYHTQYIIPFCAARRTKIVTHIHDVSFRVFPRAIALRDWLFLSFLIPRALKRSAKIIAVSHFTKNEIVRLYGIAEEKIVVVENALPERFLQMATDEVVRRVKKKYALPDKYILYVGTLQPRKNIPTLLRAFSEFQKSFSDTALVLVGNPRAYHSDPLVAKTIEQMYLRQKVVFPGFVADEDLSAVYRGALLATSASLYEGFGVPLLEAISQSVPLAVSDIGAHREVAGDGALYFSPRDGGAIAKAWKKILEDENLRRDLLARAADRLALFSWNRSAEKMKGIYEGV